MELADFTEKLLKDFNLNEREAARDAVVLLAKFKSKFNRKREELHKPKLNQSQCLELLCSLCDSFKTLSYDHFKEFIDKTEQDMLYLAEKYELYQRFVNRFKIDSRAAVGIYLNLRRWINAQREIKAVYEKKQILPLPYEEMDRLVAQLIERYSTLDELLTDMKKLENGEGPLMEYVTS